MDARRVRGRSSAGPADTITVREMTSERAVRRRAAREDGMIRKVATCAAAIVMLTVLLAGPAAGETVTLFVPSEKTDTVNVFRGKVPDLAFVKGIPVGREPHNLGISPDGRWVATGDRRSGEVSVIDTQTLVEAARLKLGRQTHDVAFTPDSRTLFVGHETETFISVVEVGTWKIQRRRER